MASNVATIRVKSKGILRFTWFMWLANWRAEIAIRSLERLQKTMNELDLTIPEIKIEGDN